MYKRNTPIGFYNIFVKSMVMGTRYNYEMIAVALFEEMQRQQKVEFRKNMSNMSYDQLGECMLNLNANIDILLDIVRYNKRQRESDDCMIKGIENVGRISSLKFVNNLAKNAKLMTLADKEKLLTKVGYEFNKNDIGKDAEPLTEAKKREAHNFVLNQKKQLIQDLRNFAMDDARQNQI